MPAWKVLVVGVLACAALGLAMATVAIPLAQSGGDRWTWLGILLPSTLVTGGLLALFLRHAGSSMAEPPRWARK
jgi:hypothetical protein